MEHGNCVVVSDPALMALVMGRPGLPKSPLFFAPSKMVLVSPAASACELCLWKLRPRLGLIPPGADHQ